MACRATHQCIDKTWACGKDKFFHLQIICKMVQVTNLFHFWKFCSHLLSQTTDSGSNNLTMAREMHKQFLAGDHADYTWHPKKMHVFCFCHKLALIVSAGLKALGLKTQPPRKLKAALQGPFPSISETIEEEDETVDVDEEVIEHDLNELTDDEEPAAEVECEDEVEKELDDEAEWDAADAEDAGNPILAIENESFPTHCREANKLHVILTKVCSPTSFSLNDGADIHCNLSSIL